MHAKDTTATINHTKMKSGHLIHHPVHQVYLESAVNFAVAPQPDVLLAVCRCKKMGTELLHPASDTFAEITSEPIGVR